MGSDQSAARRVKWKRMRIRRELVMCRGWKNIKKDGREHEQKIEFRTCVGLLRIRDNLGGNGWSLI